MSGCLYKTPQKCRLTEHMKTHSQVKQHSCNICGKGFSGYKHLIRHQAIHSDVKPFKCEECDYSSARKDKLMEHKRKHHNKNPDVKPKKRKPLPKTKKPNEMIHESQKMKPPVPNELLNVHPTSNLDPIYVGFHRNIGELELNSVNAPPLDFSQGFARPTSVRSLMEPEDLHVETTCTLNSMEAQPPSPEHTVPPKSALQYTYSYSMAAPTLVKTQVPSQSHPVNPPVTSATAEQYESLLKSPIPNFIESTTLHPQGPLQGDFSSADLTQLSGLVLF